MAMTIEQKREKLRLQQKRAIERQRAKLNDPIEQAKRRKKQAENTQKAIEKQRKRLASPEYQEKQRQAKLRQLEKQKTVKSIRKKATRGLKGRTATSVERKIMDAIGKLPCIACLQHGRNSPVISLHHTRGRTIDNAHAYILPLCAYHHDTLLDKEHRALYPDLVPIHAKGKYGGKSQFSEHNGSEDELLFKAYALADLGGLMPAINSDHITL